MVYFVGNNVVSKTRQVSVDVVCNFIYRINGSDQTLAYPIHVESHHIDRSENENDPPRKYKLHRCAIYRI